MSKQTKRQLEAGLCTGLFLGQPSDIVGVRNGASASAVVLSQKDIQGYEIQR